MKNGYKTFLALNVILYERGSDYMKKQLIIQGFTKMLSGIFALAVLLFLPAGTLKYPGAWRMIGILFVPMLILGIVLFLFNPELLAKRLRMKEEQSEQKMVILYSGIVFVLSFVLCGLDFRFQLTRVPTWLSIFACIVFLVSYIGFGELLRENEYLSRSVEVQEGQSVVSTGMYGIVRHPMYAIVLWMFLSMPIVIGSFVGLLPLLCIPYILIKRIKNEEELLKKELQGYTEYTKKVKYRLIPGIW